MEKFIFLPDNFFDIQNIIVLTIFFYKMCNTEKL